MTRFLKAALQVTLVLVGLGVLIIIIGIIDILGMPAVEVATLIANLATAIGFALLAYQIRVQRNDQKSQELGRVDYETLGAPDFQVKLAFIYRTEPQELKMSALQRQGLHEEELWVYDVTRGYNALGYRVIKGIAPKGEVIDINWEVVVRCAQKLIPHIQEQRLGRREHSKLPELQKYRGYFVWLAKECKLHNLRLVGQPSRDKWGKHISLEDLKKLLEIQPLGYLGEVTNVSNDDEDRDAS